MKALPGHEPSSVLSFFHDSIIFLFQVYLKGCLLRADDHRAAAPWRWPEDGCSFTVSPKWEPAAAFVISRTACGSQEGGADVLLETLPADIKYKPHAGDKL